MSIRSLHFTHANRRFRAEIQLRASGLAPGHAEAWWIVEIDDEQAFPLMKADEEVVDEERLVEQLVAAATADPGPP